MTYAVRYGPAARRALTSDLPEGVAAAAYACITGPLAADPYRVGKPLREPLERTVIGILQAVGVSTRVVVRPDWYY